MKARKSVYAVQIDVEKFRERTITVRLKGVAGCIDPEPEFFYASGDQVLRVAEDAGAMPYDISGAEYEYHGKQCYFDAFIAWCAYSPLKKVAQLLGPT